MTQSKGQVPIIPVIIVAIGITILIVFVSLIGGERRKNVRIGKLGYRSGKTLGGIL